jgi:hypothetical protein
MTGRNDKPVFNTNYEVVGNSPARQLSIWFRMKISVLGNFDTGPGLKNLLTLLFFHKLGRPVFWLRTWLKNRHSLKQKAKALFPGHRG